MEERQENEKLIGKLIKKRKQENDAFFKILNALESKGTPPEPRRNKRKSKS